MNTRVRAYLELIRLPNVFTAMADVVAGFLYAGGGGDDWLTLVRLAGASSCLYCGGIVLNDVCDAARDSRERPDRPIPSGRISGQAARRLAVSLFLVGLALAASVSLRAAAVGALLVVAIVLYDGILKSTHLAPALMGLCRALNLALAMSWAPISWAMAGLAPMALMWLYITSVTFFAREEAAGGGGRGRLSLGTLGVCAAVAGLTGLTRLIADAHTEYLGLVAILALGLGYCGFRAALDGTPARVQAVVRVFIGSVIVFDTCLAWVSAGPYAALLVAIILVPTLLLGRLFRVT